MKDKVIPLEKLGKRGTVRVYTQSYVEQLKEENAELKAQLESERDLPAIAYMQGAENQKKKDDKQLTYAKTIIQDLLENTDEYTRQRAEDFLKENK